jgi:hypothetical protein
MEDLLLPIFIGGGAVYYRYKDRYGLAKLPRVQQKKTEFAVEYAE